MAAADASLRGQTATLGLTRLDVNRRLQATQGSDPVSGNRIELETFTMRLNEFGRGLLVAGLIWSVTAAAWAVPYAANVRNTGGTNWEFVLNEAASNVTITRDGGNAIDLGAIGVGRHTFNMGGFSTWSIAVTQDTPVAAWSEIGDAEANQFQHFEQPVSVAVNSNPANGAYFGTIYVVNSRENATGSGRDMAEGIYAHTSDRIGVDLFTDNTFTPTLSFDNSWARKPGFTTAVSTSNSPWKIELDDAGNIVIADWTDSNGGVKYTTRDLVSGGALLAGDGGTAPNNSGRTGGWKNGSGAPVHGSIASDFRVEGVIGQAGFKIWAIDEDLQPDLNPDPVSATGNLLWRWDVDGTIGYDQSPVMERNLLATGTNPLPKTTDERLNWQGTNAGTAANLHYSNATNKYYLTEYRSDGNQAGLIVLDATGTLLWSSLQWSINNNMDGHSTLATGGTGCVGASCSIQDAFRGVGTGVSVSPDGKYLFVQNRDFGDVYQTTNPIFTTNNPELNGEVKIIPLDANGLPDIQFTGTDITNMAAIDYGSSVVTGSSSNNSNNRDVAVDAAGNVYIVDPNDTVERMKVYTPGGATIATTTATSFTVVPIVDVIPGDHNLDGTVDAADYVTWRKQNPLATNTHQGYVDWVVNFGESQAGAGGSTAVPEPASIAIVFVGLVGFALSRRGR
jgi:hypothetical protein